MKQSFKTLIGASVVASLVLTAGAASAANTAADKTCRAAIGKNIAKYQATLAKNLAGCHKARNKVGTPADCNDSFTIANFKGAAVATRAAIKTAITTACAASSNVLPEYPRCPSPAATTDNGGATTGIDDFSELSDCLTQLSEGYIALLGGGTLGTPDAPILDKVQAGCHSTIAKGIAKYIKTSSGGRAKCQAAEDKLVTDPMANLGFTTCRTTDSSGKIAPTLAALKLSIDAKCLAPTATALRDLFMCHSTPAGLKTCVADDALAPTALGLATVIFGIPNNAGALICPDSADTVINAGYGAKQTVTRLDTGYTGLAHNVDVVDNSIGTVKLQNCNADCENCEVRIDPAAGNCRCANAPTVACDAINPSGGGSAVDVDDCGGNLCHCMFGPPLALSSSGTFTCVVNRFNGDFSGGTSVVGEYDVQTKTKALVFTGLSQTQPCPTCENDVTFRDGVRNGTCDGGAQNGGSCDVNAVHPDFGNSSFDCLPSLGANISGSGLTLALSFSSGTSALTAAIPAGSNCALGTCHCSQCSGDATVGCSTDAECAALGVGTCGQNLGAANPSQNTCSGGVANCVADANTPGMGKCSMDTNKFCSEQLRGNGNGILPCDVDADCDVYDSICNGGECGTCSQLDDQSCFLPTVTTSGTPGVFNSQGVSAFCSAATTSSGVNGVAGLPGPGRVKLAFDFNVYCPGSTTVMEMPGGKNCP